MKYQIICLTFSIVYFVFLISAYILGLNHGKKLSNKEIPGFPSIKETFPIFKNETVTTKEYSEYDKDCYVPLKVTIKE